MRKRMIITFVIVDIILLCAAGVLAVKWMKSGSSEIQQPYHTVYEDKQYDEESIYQTSMPDTIESVNVPTLKKFLKNAMLPVGKTLYVYGGGWNEEDTGAGQSAVTIGVSPLWKEFFDSQGADYDSSQFRYQIEKGLDCSGYVGWAIYNTLETESGQEGYVYLAQECVDIYSQMGFGEKYKAGSFSDYRAGDILASASDCHVWISLGQCNDGSVVLVNASPPGVRICGTPARDGTVSSEAVSLAVKFMSTQFPDWYAKYPDCSKNMSYLTNYDMMRWDLSSNGVITDEEGFSDLTAEEVLTELFIG